MRKTEVVLPLSAFSDLERTGPVPIHHQISQRLEKAILSGEIPVGSRLENEVSLGTRLSLSRPTIRKAIQTLVDNGLLVRRRGVGTQVVHGQLNRSMELTSLYEDLVRAGKKPRTTVLSLEIVRAEKPVARQLSISTGSEVLKIERLRFSNNTPVALMTNYLLIQFRKVSKKELQNQGLYQWLRSQGVSVRVAQQKIGARKATKQEANLLEVDNGFPLLTMDRTAFDDGGMAIEYGQHCYRPDLYSFETILVKR